jgi:hypothetical protein
MPHAQDNPSYRGVVAGAGAAGHHDEALHDVGWTVGRNVEIDVRLAARATAAVKNDSLGPERPHPAAQARSVM